MTGRQCENCQAFTASMALATRQVDELERLAEVRPSFSGDPFFQEALTNAKDEAAAYMRLLQQHRAVHERVTV